MTWCRARQYFEYSDTALQDPNFPVFKTQLESAALQYDTSDDALSYTPHASIAVGAIVAAVQLALRDNPAYSTIFSTTVLCVSAAYTLIMSVSKIAKTNAGSTENQLIQEGTTNKFFKGPPPPLLPDAKKPSKNPNQENDDSRFTLPR